MTTDRKAHSQPLLSADYFDGEAWCDYCVGQRGTRGRLGFYERHEDLLSFFRLVRNRKTRSPQWRLVTSPTKDWLDDNNPDSVDKFVKCRNCDVTYDASQPVLQRAYALRDRDTGRIRLIERVSVR